MVPLREHLSTDEDVGLAGRHPAQGGLQRALAPDGIPVDASQPRGGKRLAEGRLDPLRARPDRTQVLGAARRTECGHGGLGAAVVAAQQTRPAVQRHARVAARAGRRPPAVVTEQSRRVAPAVQEQQGLLAEREPTGDGGEQRLREPVAHAPALQVHDREGRLTRARRPLGQHQPRVSAAPDVVQALERGRRRPQQDRHPLALAPHHRHVPRRVAEALLLLVGEVVLLVHDDDARPGQGHEHRRARAHDHRHLARARLQPRAQPLGLGQAGVQHGHRHRQAAPEAVHGLRREGDLGDEHQGLPPGLDHALDDPQVDLGLAATGHPLEQEGPEGPQGSGQRRDCPLLRGVQHGPVPAARRGLSATGGEQGLGPTPAARCLRLRRAPCPQLGRQGLEDHLADGVVIVLGRPFEEAEGRGRQERGLVDHRLHGTQPLRGHRARSHRAEAEAHPAARPERDAYARAPRGGRAVAFPEVIEGPPDRRGYGDAKHRPPAHPGDASRRSTSARDARRMGRPSTGESGAWRRAPWSNTVRATGTPPARKRYSGWLT